MSMAKKSTNEPLDKSFDKFVNKTLKLNGYEFVKDIGKGRYGKVLEAKYESPDREKVPCAVKVIARKGTEEEEKLFSREMLALTLARHKRVVQFWQFFKYSEAYFITMELCTGGSMQDLLCNAGDKKYFPLWWSMLFSKDLCSGLHFLHHQDITHRDLKPENILLDRFKRVKIADFGFAKRVTNSLSNTVCGTADFMAPELFRSAKKSTIDPKKLDCWGWGLLCYLAFTKKMPFSLDVLKPNFRKPTATLDIYPKLLREFNKSRVPASILSSLRFALAEDPDKRTSMCVIQGQEWYGTVTAPQDQE